MTVSAVKAWAESLSLSPSDKARVVITFHDRGLLVSELAIQEAYRKAVSPEGEVQPAARESLSQPLASPSANLVQVTMKQKGGAFYVPVSLNGALTLDFLIDSGASDVGIPADVVMTLVRTGTIREADFIGEQTYVLADGTQVKSKTFRLRSVQVGSKVIENVVASIASVNGNLLLGQSFLGRFNSWSIDNKNHALVLD
jgi:clan AA aspartic protease (TIGR02281 family)